MRPMRRRAAAGTGTGAAAADGGAPPGDGVSPLAETGSCEPSPDTHSVARPPPATDLCRWWRCPSLHRDDGGVLTVRCSSRSLVICLAILAAAVFIIAGAPNGTVGRSALRSPTGGGAAERVWPSSNIGSGEVFAGGGLARSRASKIGKDDNARVLVLDVPTPSMPRRGTVPATIVLPASYSDSLAPDDGRGHAGNNRTYSVLYLLHGATDNHGSWIQIAPLLPRYASALNIILVCPDGAGTSWYFDSPLDPEFMYETFVSKDLISYVDSKYRTRPNKEGRAIMGMSMGGHGALFLSLRHPEVFGTAVSMSGGLDIRPFPNNWDMKKRLGPLESNAEVWDNHTVMVLAERMLRAKTFPKELGISIDDGTGDFFLEVNRQFHRLLVEHKIDHDYAERPGGHSRDYWKRNARYQMEFVDGRLNGVDDN